MNRKLITGIAGIVALIIGALAFVWISGGSGEASVDIGERAAQLSLDSTAEVTAETTQEATEAPTSTTVPPTRTPRPTTQATTVENTVAPTNTTVPPTPRPTNTPEPTKVASVLGEATRALFRINSAESLVTFVLQEDLRGQRIDVIGTTRDVGGDVIVDVSNPSASQVGALVINARTLETDNQFRNQAIRGQILRSADSRYEFIEFTPTKLEGLPTDALTALGGTLAFKVTGDLKILETTREVTFDASVTLSNATTLRGEASAVITWSDYGIIIPSVPGVANVSPQVTLKIVFVADLIETR